MQDSTLKFYPLNYVPAYWSPCDLGRNPGVHDVPGKLINQIHIFI